MVSLGRGDADAADGVDHGESIRPEEADRSEAALGVARRQLAKALGILGKAVDGKRFLVDNEFSAADIMVGYGLTLAKTVGELPEEPPSVPIWLAGLAERPAYQRAFDGGFG